MKVIIKQDIIIFLNPRSKRPIIIAGQGIRIAGAVKQLNSLINQLNIPVVTSRMGIDLIGSNNSLFVGRPGIKGDRAGNFAVQNSDLILSIGSRLSVPVVGYDCDKFAREAKKIVVDVDDIEHQKTTIKIDTFVKSDALLFIEMLAKCSLEAKLKKDNDWPVRCRKWKITYPVVLKKYKESSRINTYYFTDILSKVLIPTDIIVIDSGSSSYVVSQGIKIKYGQRYIVSGGLGAMGYAVPAAIGISMAINKKRVVCITGDGSFHMNMQELSIITHKKLPIKLFIFNNHGYSSIKATQHNYFKSRFIGVDKNSGVYLSDILSIAKLYGIKGIRLEKTDDIEMVCKEVLAYNGPVLCDVICSSSQPVIPTAYSVKNDSGIMISKPLEDMYPFLGRKTFLSEMIVKPVD